MKLQTILPAFLLAAAASLPFGAYAATDADKSQAADAQADKPAAKKTKPHSDMKATTTAAEEKASKPKADKDKSKHFHPRDGK